MAGHREQITRRILREFRNLMTETERRADRAFAFQQRVDLAADPARRAELSTVVAEALGDAAVLALYQKGRLRFLDDMTQRVLSEHGPDLPRCAACGEVLKQPNPKDCFDCNR